MANEVGRGVVGIEPDLSGFQEKIGREVEQATSAASRRAQKSIDVGKRLTLGVTLPIVALGGAAIRAASDVEEMQAKFQTVFGGMSGEVEDWARLHADAVNRSRFDIQGYLATLQDTFVPMGIARGEAAELSKQIAALGIDLASFNNLAEPEVIQNLTSALVGNHEAVRRFGVVITEASLNAELMRMGIEGGSRAASEQEKILARVNLIVAGTADAQGDAARTSESFANQLRGMKANLEETAVELGTHLLPLATDMVKVFSSAVEVFTSLPEPVQRSIVVAGGLAAAIGPLAIIGGQAAKGIIAMKAAADAFRAVRAARQLTTVATGIEAIGANAAGAIPSVGNLATRAGVMTVAFLGAAAAADKAGTAIGDALGTTRPDFDVNRITTDLQTLVAGLESAADLSELDAVFRDTTFGIDGLGDAIDRITGPSAFARVRDVTAAMASLGGLIGDTSARDLTSSVTAVQLLDDALSSLARSEGPEAAGQALELLADRQGLTAEQIDRLMPLLDEYNIELQRNANETALAGESADGLSDAQRRAQEAVTLSTAAHDRQTAAIDRVKKAHDEYEAALRAAVNPVLRLNRAIGAVDDAQQSYNEAIEEYGRGSAEARQAGLELASALSDAEQAAIDGDLSFDEFAAKLRSWVAQGVLTAEQAEEIGGRVAELRGEADRYSGTYTAHLEAQLPTEDIDSLRASLRDLTSKRWTVIVDQMVRGDRLPAPGGVPVPRARGGPLGAGQLALVGEEGPELWVPDAAGQVVSHDNTVKQLADSIVNALRNTAAPAGLNVGDIYVGSRADYPDLAHELRMLAAASG